jgi:dGTPase
VLTVTQANLKELAPRTPADIREAGRMMVQFSPGLWSDLKVIREFLFHRMYRAPDVVAMRKQVTHVIHSLFPMFMSDPSLLPKQWRKDVAEAQSETQLARIVADYIAGMTDRFALQEHARLTGTEVLDAHS